VVARSKIEEDPRLKTMWAGYAFSVDYREKRGHAYMLTDQTFTERQKVAKQPGTCLNCHASMVTIYNKLGNGDMWKGFDAVNHTPYFEVRREAEHPVACIDCHDPNTMALRITRPAFIEGIRALKGSQGVKDYDVNTQATRQEMRSFVCGQCHVEYYFKGPEKRLTYPWINGVDVEKIVDYYNNEKFKDWVHAETGTEQLKAQHPEFEMWNHGIHGRSGVACADCHMPYMREGGVKISDHWVRSPLLNINRACQTCHRWPEQELKDRVEEIQTRFFETRNIALDALMQLIADIKSAKEAGASDADLQKARDSQRRAQFYIDFVVSENSMGFHADQYAVKVLAEAIDVIRQGQLSLRKPASTKTVSAARPERSGR
jgi:nitrite reductase (cytochrome c-552)